MPTPLYIFIIQAIRIIQEHLISNFLIPHRGTFVLIKPDEGPAEIERCSIFNQMKNFLLKTSNPTTSGQVSCLKAILSQCLIPREIYT